MAFEGAIQVIATLFRRIFTKVAVRGALVMAPAVYSNEVAFIDLRGKLPTNGEYEMRDMTKVNTVIIHHSASTGQTINSLAQFHIDAKGWPAIAYHFAVGWDGKVYQLNDVDRKTFHAQGWNTRAIGVCLIGNYQENPLPDAAFLSVGRLVMYLSDKYRLPVVLFHRDTKATLCPGQYAVDALRVSIKGPSGL